MDKLRELQALCRSADDDARWLIALVSDTGMRLAEAAGLTRSDIVLNGVVPHAVVQEHPWRRLKTASSARKVPLVGEALWAAQRIVSADSGSKYAFPRYNKTGKTNANSASAALNKWMKSHVPERCTMHSFRHSMRDRLRAVECPSAIVDQIGGWQTEGVGQGYGKGYPIEVLWKWLEKTV
ncbi:tyrosine-type recombinase/integrase [Donghicola sp. XS_ASV15]|uniref:tyrosine-type recombinase/integrase n=1 Tax=Donghicola sp. XS_ASV15 TaxID=3241295 RepID=UPI003515C0E1